MRRNYKLFILEAVSDGKVVCDVCGWTWKLSEGGKDKYICHKCGNDNNPNATNLDNLFKKFQSKFPAEYQNKFTDVKNFIIKYITTHGYKIKLQKSCQTAYAGVRLKDYIIICSPSELTTFGDFIYTLFHEIRHESQISKIKMTDPLSEMDLEDFENLYKQYWEMELDADQFAKNMVGQIVKSLKIPMDIAVRELSLSEYIKNYPSMSKTIENYLKQIVNDIKRLKKSGEYEGLHDHPLIKRNLDKLESLL